MTPIQIEFADGFKVSQGDRYADCLTFGEMLEIVIAATREHQRSDIPLAWMKTKEQWDEYKAFCKGMGGTDENGITDVEFEE